MKFKSSAIESAIFVVVALLSAALAQKPKITNAKIEEAPAGTSLKALVDPLSQANRPAMDWLSHSSKSNRTHHVLL